MSATTHTPRHRTRPMQSTFLDSQKSYANAIYTFLIFYTKFS